VPDLHGWITQQIDATQHAAEAAAQDGTPDWHAKTHFRVADGNGDPVVYDEGRPTEDQARHIALHDPAAVLRRCAADRKILEHHAPNTHGIDVYACTGCGSDDYGWTVDHTNDCPTLLALAEGYGLTDEQAAQLDRPEPERPKPSPGFMIPNAISEGLYRAFISTRPMEPSPEEKAVKILEPELNKISIYAPVTKEPKP
jgi:hypothetical protein